MMTNHGNRITQGQFSFLPDLTDAQITAQIEYALKNGWAVSVEYTDDPHPRNTYWEMFGNADVRPEGCGRHHDGDQRLPEDLSRTTTSASRRSIRCAASRARQCRYIVNRPKNEPGFVLQRAGRPRPADPLHDREPTRRTSPRANATRSG